MIGTSIAHYTITAKLGAGGMGEVWRATDTKLGRDVALKIIPEIFTQDVQRMARFHREAQLLASLNHPNIAAIYGVEEAEGRRALVLELVEGEDLHERLSSGPIPLDETLAIARQIAEALEAAHEKGVVHRDLKPANVKLTRDGAVKVLDFGLAKALEGETGPGGSDPSQSLSPTLTQAATKVGVILGTAAYMSPEQAKGKSVDRRADIFSFGVVLFEMLSRRQCFAGETISDTLASVLKVTPDWSLIPSGTPAPVVELLHRCLEKDPKQRLQSIGEARISLAALLGGGSRASTMAGIATDSSAAMAGGVAQGGGAAPGKERARKGPAIAVWLALLVVASAVAGVAGWKAGVHSAPEIPVRQFAIEPAGLTADFGRAPIISPDGLRIAYLAEDSLWIRDLDALTPRQVPESAGGRSPIWSGDGGSLAWEANGRLYKIAATGGQPVALASLGERRLHGGAWGADGTIYITSSGGGIDTLSSLGGEIRTLLGPVKGAIDDYHSIAVLPGGRGIIYTVHVTGGRGNVVEILKGGPGGERIKVLDFPGERIERTMYDPGGYLVFSREFRNDGVWAVPFSLDSMATTGDPFLVDPEGDWPSVSRDGTLLYTKGAGSPRRQLAIVDRQGALVRTIGAPQTGMDSPSLSWDGTRALVSAAESESRDIWMHDIERGTATRMTFSSSPAGAGGAAWLPGDRRIAFTLGTGLQDLAIWSAPVDMAGEATQIIPGGVNVSFRPGVPFAAFAHISDTTAWDVHRVPLGEDGLPDGDPVPIIAGPKNDYDIQISPGGDYIAYASRESGTEQIYVKTFPGGEGKWQVSGRESYWPRWSRKGDELYFLQPEGNGTALMAVRVEKSSTLRLSTPVPLFDEKQHPDIVLDSAGRSYDVFPDGERFLVLRVPEGATAEPPKLVISQSWAVAFDRSAKR